MPAQFTVESIGGKKTPGNKKVMSKSLKSQGPVKKNAGRNAPKQNAPSKGTLKRKSSVLIAPPQDDDDSESDDDIDEDVEMGSDESDDETNDQIEAESSGDNDSDVDENNDSDDDEDNDSEGDENNDSDDDDSDDSEDEPESPKKRKVDSEAQKHKLTNAEIRIDAKEKKLKKAKDIEINSKYNDRTIFVGNVSIETKKNKLKAHFSKFGKVVAVRFRSVPVADTRTPKKVALIKKEFHTKRKTMNAFVRFEKRNEALKALVENGKLLNGTHIRVNMCDSDVSKCDGNKSIFLGNVSFDAEDDDLWNIFKPCGDIESVRIIRDKRTNIAKGFAYVNFVSADSVELALQMEKVTLNNRELRISVYSAKDGKKNEAKGKAKRDLSSEKKNKDSQNTNKGGPGGEKKNFQKKFSPGQKKNKKQSNPKPVVDGSPENKSPKATGFQGSKFAQKKKNKVNKGLLMKKKMAKKIAPV